MLSRQKIVRSILKFTNHSRGIRWWLRDESLIPVARYVAGAVGDIAKNAMPAGIEMLKLNERKAVFRFGHPQKTGSSFVAKAFFFKPIERCLKYHKYGLDETANLLMARDKGVSVPGVYGYGHISNVLGIPKVSMIILEDFQSCSHIGVLMRSKSEKDCAKIFMRTIPLFVSLYNASCNHIDVNSGAVMIGEDNFNHSVFLLDFQHAVFYDKPSTEILIFEAGYFARHCSAWVSTETIGEWMDELFAAVGSSNTADEVEKMRERFKFYFDNGIYMSRKERRKIH